MLKPDPARLLRSRNGTLPDILARGLDVLFVGINPSLYSAAVGHHFARPGNRFWPALHAAGFTPRRLSPDEDGSGPSFGFGLTNLVDRATARADELEDEELRAARGTLERKVQVWRPRFVAIVGVTAYRGAFAEPQATLGEQSRALAGARLWVLPNPSGLNAHYPLARLGELFGALKHAIEATRESSP